MQAAKLLVGKTFPGVPKLIKEMRQARERRYGVTLLNRMKRFEDLSIAAEEAGQFPLPQRREDQVRTWWPDH